MKWKTIEQHKNYQVSDTGMVRNFKTKYVLSTFDVGRGYLLVPLYICKREGKSIKKFKRVARLVAETFLPNLKNLSDVDHLDGDKKNNHLKNLRWCSRSQNMLNTSSHKNSSSKYKGVYWNKSRKLWQSSACVSGKQTWLGVFKREKDAALAYNKFIVTVDKDFARLNKV